MYKGLSVAAIIPVLNEEAHIVAVLRRIPRGIVDETVVVDDGSTDRSPAMCREEGATVIAVGRTEGVGSALRHGFGYASKKGYDVVVVMAGNNKDSPEQVPRLLEPIVDGSAHLVQGSRYLERGEAFGEMPSYRRIATRLHSALFSRLTGVQFTDSTNGFRAICLRLLEDPALTLEQGWLDEYELEPYLLYKAVKLGYRVREVPVSKVYPPRELGQTKMRPVSGWWSILRPILLLAFRIKR